MCSLHYNITLFLKTAVSLHTERGTKLFRTIIVDNRHGQSSMGPFYCIIRRYRHIGHYTNPNHFRTSYFVDFYLRSMSILLHYSSKQRIENTNQTADRQHGDRNGSILLLIIIKKTRGRTHSTIVPYYYRRQSARTELNGCILLLYTVLQTYRTKWIDPVRAKEEKKAKSKSDNVTREKEKEKNESMEQLLRSFAGDLRGCDQMIRHYGPSSY